MARQRKTWKQAEQDKTASPPPQMPAVDRTEEASHPAYHKDPEADQYEKGDTSAWAEDPHKPMDEESPPPAMPGNHTTEEPTHPALSDFQKKPEKAEGGTKQASLKEMAEQRANLCVRIASAMMPGADVSAVEDKALQLMDFDEDQLRAAALILAGEEEEEREEEEEMEMEGSKKAALEITARLDRLESSMGKLVQAMNHFFGMEGDEDEGMSDKELMAYLMAEDMDGDGVDQNDPQYGYSDKEAGEEEEMLAGEEDEMMAGEEEEMLAGEEDEMMAMDEDGEEEAMLRAMLEEMDEDMGKEASDAEDATDPLAKGESIQSGEGGNTSPDDYAETPVVAQADGKDEVADPTPHGSKEATDSGAAENDIEIATGADPMGLMGDKSASADDELMQLYADLELHTASDDEEEEEEEEEMEEEATEEEEGKKAGLELKPQPKKASAGAKTLGNVPGQPKVASDEMDLSKLWESAPDVSSVFGTTPTR